MNIQRPPSPKGNFLLGHLSEFRKDSLGYERFLAKTYGDVVHVRFANRHVYLISHPDDVRQVLVDEPEKFNKAPIYRSLLSYFLGNGLLTSDGDFWRRQRVQLEGGIPLLDGTEEIFVPGQRQIGIVAPLQQ